jgi:hypothetical protein
MSLRCLIAMASCRGGALTPAWTRMLFLSSILASCADQLLQIVLACSPFTLPVCSNASARTRILSFELHLSLHLGQCMLPLTGTNVAKVLTGGLVRSWMGRAGWLWWGLIFKQLIDRLL